MGSLLPGPTLSLLARDLDVMRVKWLDAVRLEDRAAETVLMARIDRLLDRWNTHTRAHPPGGKPPAAKATSGG